MSVRLARLQREQLGDLEAALALLAELLQADPKHVEAVAELEALVAHRAWERSSTLLLTTYRRGRDFKKLAVHLEACAPAYLSELGDFKLSPKKHVIDPRTGLHPALGDLLQAASGWASQARSSIRLTSLRRRRADVKRTRTTQLELGCCLWWLPRWW